MIVYFDTSALLPILIDEPGSENATRLWDEADHVVSVRLVYAEARAALAQAGRMGRVTPTDLEALTVSLELLYAQLDHMEIDDQLVRRAGGLAEELGLRGYDAVHLAGVERLDDTDVVLAAGDRDLLDAAMALGISIGPTA